MAMGIDFRRAPEAGDTVSERIDRELRMRGTSLARWAAEHGLTSLDVVAALEGLSKPPPEVLFDLEETIGATVHAISRAVS
jgi:hypothetical protein